MSHHQSSIPFPQAVIFDLDGTLVSSSLDFRAMCAQTGCVPGQDILQFMEALSPPEKNRVANVIHEHEMQDAHSCEVLPGVHSMLMALKEKKVRMAIVTRNSAPATYVKLARTGIELEHVITREDAPPKPAPDALITLAKQWGVDQQSCVYVGDYIYDLEAAHRAGMHSALYAAASLPEFSGQAHFVFRHHDEFEAALRGYWGGLAL
jgi:HAD superfamily hydrolase (TIGR01509 family)